jgi:hypothetical protein
MQFLHGVVRPPGRAIQDIVGRKAERFHAPAQPAEKIQRAPQRPAQLGGLRGCDLRRIHASMLA